MNRKSDIDLILRREAALARESMRAITLYPENPGGEPTLPGDPSIEASGAVHLDIQDILPTIDAYGMGLPPGIQTAQGVIGNEIWPISADDVEMEEPGEVDALTDQSLSFDNITPTPHRVALALSVSNAAIDNAAFDLVSWLRSKVQIGVRKYLARRFYSFENWDGNKGPWAGADTVDIADDLSTGIEAEITQLHEQGFDTNAAYIVMNLQTERRLKQTLVKEGCAKTIIDDGLCLGYPYVVSKYFGTRKDDEGQLVNIYDTVIGVGIMPWFAVHQHAGGRIVLDGASAEVAKKNITAFVVNLWFSMTNLASAMYNGDTGENNPMPFHLLMTRKQYLADVGGLIFQTSDNKYLAVAELPWI